MAIEGLEISHHGNGDSGEYRATVSDSDAVGKLTWKQREQGVRVADHTLVPEAISGRGIAAALVDRLIEDARAQGFKIVPQCSYIEAKFRKNPEWSDLRA